MAMSEAVEKSRVVDLCRQLVNIPSPTGSEREIAEFLAGVLKEFSEVTTDYEFPQSPTVVARLKLGRGGKVLQFDGHLDHVAVDHPPPKHTEEEIIARGACDMKAGLAAMVEAAKVLSGHGERLNGELLITAHGLHEAPIGSNEPVYDMIRKGYFGDSVIVCEGMHRQIPVSGMGMGIFEVCYSRKGEALHENHASDTPNPLAPAATLAAEILSKRFFGKEDPFLGMESWFLGQLSGGDFYNRLPVSARLVGTRRWHPWQRAENIEKDVLALAQGKSLHGIRVDLDFRLCGKGWQTDPDSDLIRSVQEGWGVVGVVAPLVGMRTVTNVEIFTNEAGIPGTSIGVDLATAHSDVERVRVADIQALARVLVASAVAYFNKSE